MLLWIMHIQTFGVSTSMYPQFMKPLFHKVWVTTCTHNSYCEIPQNKTVLSLGFSMNASRVTIAATQRRDLIKHMDVLYAVVWQSLGPNIFCGLLFCPLSQKKLHYLKQFSLPIEMKWHGKLFLSKSFFRAVNFTS